jgi:hypothetical protein
MKDTLTDDQKLRFQELIGSPTFQEMAGLIRRRHRPTLLNVSSLEALALKHAFNAGVEAALEDFINFASPERPPVKPEAQPWGHLLKNTTLPHP